MKIFVIGMFKTGLTSLCRALRIGGFNVFKGPWWNGEIQICNYNEHPELWSNYYDCINQKVQKFDAFTDYPWMYLYEYCDKWFSESKFIFTDREINSLLKSTMNQYPEKDQTAEKNEIFKTRYEKHKDAVLDYFKGRDDFLVMNLAAGDGWEKLCSFLKIDRPLARFPHANRAIYRK